MNKFNIVSFYTEGPYEEVLRTTLKPSIEKFNLLYSISGANNYKDWLKNVNQKPEIILREWNNMLISCLVFLDADSEIREYPILFEQLPKEVDIAFHRLNCGAWYQNGSTNKELLSGTLFIRKNPKTKALVQEWATIAKTSNTWEQKILDNLLKLPKYSHIVSYELPIEYCYDDKTEILTDQGWKLFKDLDKTELIASLNIKNNTVEYQKPIKYYENQYNGKMIKFNSRRLDLVITPDHNVFIKNKHKTKTLITKINQVKNNQWIWIKKDFNLINKNKKPSKTQDLFNQFLIWFATEGHLSNCKGNNYKISLSQKTHYKKIENLLLKNKFKFCTFIDKRNNVKVYHIYQKNLFNYILNTCGRGSQNKKLPRFLLNYDNKTLKNYFKILIMGDGWFGKKDTYTFVSKSKQLVDFIVELGLKINLIANVKYSIKYKIYHVNFTKTTWVLSTKRTEEDYSGMIYCLQVPNKIIYVRRNGKMCWSGNCYINSLPGDREPFVKVKNPIIVHYQKSRTLKKEVAK